MYHNYDMETILAHIRNTPVKKLILDTDTYNEIDDQYAVTYAMLSPDIDLLALTAAPFCNSRAAAPGEGMEKSYQEMVKVRDMIDPAGKRNIPCFRGSSDYMKNTITPQPSEAADNIIRLVHESDDIVYIAVIGCYTNAASALLQDPSIMDKAVILMIGANKFEREDANEFNLMQDRAAARVIFECGIPVVVLPAIDCTERLYTSTGEMLYYLWDKAGSIGNYLCQILMDDEHTPEEEDGTCHSRQRTIWDIGAIAFLRK
ncbi:MAG: nucleoside hydrolase, partial [Clostridia bacterium]|nr:nucleoside hydrolase [Clostridia bacterium]